MPLDELAEYCTYLPEWRNLTRAFDRATIELYEFLKKKLPSAMHHAFNVEQPFYPGPVFELYGITARLANTFNVTDNGIHVMTPFRTFLQKTFATMLFTRLTYDLIDFYRTLPTTIVHQGQTKNIGNLLSARLNAIFSHLAESNRNIFPWGMPGVAEQESIRRIKGVNSTFGKNLLSLADSGDDTGNESDEAKLRQKIDEKHELISELINTIPFSVFDYKGENFRINYQNIRASLPLGGRADVLCMATIIPDPNFDQEIPHHIDIRDNMFGIKFDVKESYYDAFIPANSADLQISNELSLGTMFTNRIQYLKTVNAVFGILLDHLLELEKRVSKSERPQKSVKTVEDETAQAVQATLEQPKKPRQQYKPTVQQEIPEKPLSAEEKRKARISLKNRKGNIVLRTLERILGPAVRCEGTSHFIFRGKTGHNYPIAIHAGKDIGTGLLKKCLDKYGISLEEFDEAYA
jgi:predicted RNA binding protein YcfA (HicA-like mRNA interferase family)